MALTKNPVLLSSQQELISKGGDPKDPGVTSPPANFSVTDFRVFAEEHKRKRIWRSRIEYRKACHEGSNSSYYLGAGVYPCGMMYSGGYKTYYAKGKGNREIAVIVDKATSEQARRAEQEHCDDILRAYKLTLKEMDDAIARAQKRLQADMSRAFTERSFSKSTALKVAKDILKQECPDNTLKKIVEESLQQDTVLHSFTEKMGALYRDTAAKTATRDFDGWHTFEIDRNEYKPWFASCRGYDVTQYDYRKLLMPLWIAQGKTSPSSVSIITLS